MFEDILKKAYDEGLNDLKKDSRQQHENNKALAEMMSVIEELQRDINNWQGLKSSFYKDEEVDSGVVTINKVGQKDERRLFKFKREGDGFLFNLKLNPYFVEYNKEFTITNVTQFKDRIKAVLSSPVFKRLLVKWVS